MHIDLLREKTRTFPTLENPSQLRSARVWHCSYRTLAPIARCIQLETLVIATFPDDNLAYLTRLQNLRYLSILHLPRVSDLAPLADLRSLKTLSLETLPSWDASGKVTTVASLDPIAALDNLQHLQLLGVCPPDRSLAPLERCKALVSARFSKYPDSEISRFHSATGVADALNPNPEFSATRI